MSVKLPSQTAAARRQVSPDTVAALTNELAGKPYARGVNEHVQPAEPVVETVKRTSISLPAELLERTEDLALKNKRAGDGAKSVSAIVRDALNDYFDRLNK